MREERTARGEGEGKKESESEPRRVEEVEERVTVCYKREKKRDSQRAKEGERVGEADIKG